VAGTEAITTGMAGRYATALFDLARDEHALDQVLKDLDAFDGLVASNPDLDRLVRSPVFTAEEQVRALSPILAKAAIGGLAANFLKLIAQNRRLFAVREMSGAYKALVARHKGEVRAEVTLAEKPSEAHLGAIRDALKAASGGKQVALEVNIDPAIIGGLVVKLGSKMVDSSLRTKLNAIRHAMKEVG
jgi:F-type H+-transporting ATPase subunit delta